MTFTFRLLANAVACGVVGAAALVLAADAPAKPGLDGAGNTTITAQKMTVRNQENKAIFEGGVVMTRAGLEVHSDMMVVSFKAVAADAAAAPNGSSPKPAEKTGGAVTGKLPTMGNRAVSMVEATGRVRIIKDDGQATCGKAVYLGDEEKIVLTESPVAWQKGARVTGKKITMYLAEDRSVVEGESRVSIQQDAAAK
jgi:lipopolysaccharide export system protein LptA